MAHNSYEVHSWECSVFDCGQKLTGAQEDSAEQQGWDNVTIFGENFDLCPSCVIELKEFFFGIDDAHTQQIVKEVEEQPWDWTTMTRNNET